MGTKTETDGTVYFIKDKRTVIMKNLVFLLFVKNAFITVKKITLYYFCLPDI